MWLADVDLLSSEALWVVREYQEGLYRHKVEPVNLHLKKTQFIAPNDEQNSTNNIF